MAEALIYSSHALFRNGLSRLIGDVADVRLVSSLDELVQLARSESARAVILDQGDADSPVISQIITDLLRIPGLKVITVSLNADVVQIFHREEVRTETVHALRRTLTEHFPK